MKQNSSILPLFHLLGAASFAFAIYYDVYEVKIPEERQEKREKFGGHYKYLTFLNMILQCIFFSVSFLANFSTSFVKTRDLIFSSAAFPIGIFSGCIFWSLFFVNRELVFPKWVDEFFPWWLNHLMHTTVLPLLVTTINYRLLKLEN